MSDYVVTVEEARALATMGGEALMLPKEALAASQRVLAQNLLQFIDGPFAQRFINFGLVVWGSDCTECGNATPESMTCDTCCSDEHAVALWMEADADHDKSRHHPA